MAIREMDALCKCLTMNRIMHILSALFITPFLFVGCVKKSDSSVGYGAVRPNIIIVFVDDQGYNDLGCYGSKLIKTPNIDRLASEGMRFTNFYAQPICGPSRTALLTGCYPMRVAELGNTKRVHPSVHPDELLLPEVLKTVGYTTGIIGKWDLNRSDFDRLDARPNRQGFDYWFGTPSSNDGGIRQVYRNEELLDVDLTVNNITKRYTQEALDFIDDNATKPFFLYLPHNMPHTKLGASKDFEGNSSMGLYGDTIEEIDWSVGEIMKKLKEKGLDKNTIVVYTSDNGPWQVRGTHAGSAYPLRGGKITTWEGGVRVPCVIWGHPVSQKGTIGHVASNMDFYPTLINLAGASLPSERIVDGHDLSSFLTAPKMEYPKENEIYFYYLHTHLQGVRKEDWKLVLPRPQAPEWIGIGKKSIWKKDDVEPVRGLELYNLRKDPSERRNLAQSYPEKVKELMLLINHARHEIGDFNSIGNGARFYDPDEPRPAVKKWKELDLDSLLKQEKIHPFYDDGSRNL